MITLLQLHKWQIALAAALVYIVWPYFQTTVAWMSANPATRELVGDTVITVALAYIAFTVWNDQRPIKSRKASS